MNVGERVFVDAEDPALILDLFLRGSTSHLFPHARVRFVGGGDECVAVAIERLVPRIGCPNANEAAEEELRGGVIRWRAWTAGRRITAANCPPSPAALARGSTSPAARRARAQR